MSSTTSCRIAAAIACAVEMHLGEFLRDCDRMRNVGFAGLARLTVMSCSAKLVGAHDVSICSCGR